MKNYVIIHYDNGSKQVVRPSDKFSGNWKDLVLSITNSTNYNKNYSHYEVK